MPRFIRRLAGLARASNPNTPARSVQQLRTRLWLSALEDRCVPATFTVSNTGDNGGTNPAAFAGTGTLRQAIVDANATAGIDDIVFSLGAGVQTISVTAVLPSITGPVNITNTTGAANLVVTRTGAAAYSVFTLGTGAATVNMTGLTVSGGSAASGGGINMSTAATLTVTSSVIRNNASTGNGGGIFVASGGIVSLVNTTVSGNTSGGRGGGVYFFSGGSLTVTGSTISGNTANSTSTTYSGGGISWFGTVAAPGFTIRNSTIHGNTAGGTGGGIAFRSLSGTATIQNSTVTGNTAGSTVGGGNIARTSGTGTIVLGSVVVAEGALSGTAPTTTRDLLNSTGTLTVTTSFVGVADGLGLSSPNITGTAATPAVPQLGALQDNGGPTFTRAPNAGSPLLNVGSNPAGLSTDQRGLGYTRAFGAAADIGALEVQPVGLPSASATAANVTTPGGTSYTFTVTYLDPTGTNNGINVSSLINNNAAVRVTGPNGFDVPATYVTIDTATNGTPRTVTYSITPPGGSWDGGDNGTYTIAVQASQVTDLDANVVPAGAAGTFQVVLPPANDLATGAIPIPLNGVVVGTTANANNNYALTSASATQFSGVANTVNAAAGGDVVYSFTASAGTYVARLNQYSGTATGNPILYVASSLPAGAGPADVTGTTLVAANRTTTGADVAEAATFTLSAPGTVFIVVDELTAGQSGSFRLEVTRPGQEAEGNDTPGAANTYVFGSGGMSGDLTSGSDIDYYSLGSPAAGSLMFAMLDSRASSATDSLLRFTNSTDTLEFDDDDGDGAFGALSSVIAGAAAPGGGVFLSVAGFSSALISPYRLLAVVQPAPAGATAETDPGGTGNNTIATANAAAPNYFSGAIASAADTDFYGTTAAAGDLIFVGLDSNPGRTGAVFDGALALFDAAGNQLVSVNGAGTGVSTTSGAGNLTATNPYSPGEALAYRVTIAGNYYVRVSGTAAGNYLLSVSKNLGTGGGGLAPTVTTGAGTTTYTENAAAVAVDATLTVADDGANLTGATVTIGAGYVNGQDVLAFTAVGGITGSFVAATGTLTLTGTSSLVNYQTALRSVTFVANGENPTAGARTITFVGTDLAGLTSTAAKTVNVVAVNDAPMNAVPGGLSVNPLGTIGVAGVNATDADLAAGNLTVTVSVPVSSGTFTGTGFTSGSGTNSISVTGPQAAVTAALATLQYTAPAAGGDVTVTVVTSDGGSTGTGGTQTDTDTFVIHVNSAPIVILTAGNATYTEDDAAVVIDPGLTIIDADSPTLAGAVFQVTTGYVSAEDVLGFSAGALPGGVTADTSTPGIVYFNGTASVAAYQALLRTATYRNSSQNPSTATRSLAFAVLDPSTLISTSVFRVVDVVAVNDAPVNVVPGATVAVTAGTTNNPLAGVSASDADSGSLSANVQVTAGTLSVTASGSATVSGNNSANLTVDGSTADVNATLATLLYDAPPAGGTVTVTVLTTDTGTPLPAATATDTFDIAVNGIPVVTLSGATPAYTEDDTAAVVDASLTVTDDGTNLSAATVTISAGFVSAEDVLGFSAGALPGTVTADTSVPGTITFTGSATVTAYQTLLQSVTYANTSQNPTTAARTVTFTVTDAPPVGTAVTSAPVATTVAVVSVNDAPMTTVPGTLNQSSSSTAAVPGVSVADVDVAPGNLTVTVGVSAGSLSGTGFTPASGASISITGTASVVNAALATLQYTSTAAGGPVTVTVDTDDNGNTGGSALTDTDTFIIEVSAPPVLTAGGSTATYFENAAPVVVDPGLVVTDIDSANLSSATVAITTGFVSGEDTLGYNTALLGGLTATAGAGTITFSGVASKAVYEALLRSVTYVNLSDFPTTAPRTVSFTATDAITNLSTLAPATTPVAVVSTNDAPTVTTPAGPFVTLEDTARTVSGFGVADLDGGTADETVTVTVTGGTVTLAGISGLTTVSGNGSDIVTLTGPLSALNAALGVLTFAPDADRVAAATIAVSIDDNGNTSTAGDPAGTGTGSVTVSLTAVNDAPSFTPGPSQTVLEDSGANSVSAWATGISAGPADEAGQTLTFVVTAADTTKFFVQPAVSSTGVLTFTPALNAVGTTTITVFLRDSGGVANSGANQSTPSQTFTITLTPVNDAPTFTKGPDQTVVEDGGPQTIPNWASAPQPGPVDELPQSLQYIVTNTNNPLFLVQPAISAAGTLTYTTNPNLFGSATVTVTLMDNGMTANGGADTSPPQTFTITVVSINDAPTFDLNLTALTAGPDPSPVTVTGAAGNVVVGPGDEVTAGQTFSYEVTNNATVLFTVQPSISPAGVLTFTPSTNLSGHATVSVRVRDSGGTANGGNDLSVVKTFDITVIGTNAAPTFTKGPDQTVLEGSGPQTVSGWATNLSAGRPEEAGQMLDFLVTTNNNALFSVPPAISPAGTLTYTPAPNAAGTVTVTVRLHDDGGTAFGGLDTSLPQTFLINLTPVNDVPSFTLTGSQVGVNPGDGPQTKPGFATNISAGPADESGQVLTFQITTTNNALFTTLPAIDPATGTLTFTTTGVSGSATVFVRLMDNGGVANGGVELSAAQSFVVVVAPGAGNTLPTASPDLLTVAADSGATPVPVTGNDSTAPDVGETLTVIAVSQPANGTVVLSGGLVTYQPAAGFSGADSFLYTVSDGNGGQASATVTVTVTPSTGTPTPVPPPKGTVTDLVALGSQTGSAVRVIDATTGAVTAAFDAFPGTTGGVNVALADLNADGVADIIVGAGVGGSPHVKVYNGALVGRDPSAALMASFFGFLDSLRGGVRVAAADVNGDGVPDLVLGAGAGGAPHVKVVDGTKLGQTDANGLPAAGALLASFFAYAPDFNGGVNVAAADVNGDGKADVVTGAGVGGSPHVKVFDGKSFAEVRSIIPYGVDFRGGVNVSAGDLDGDGFAEIVTGAGFGGAPHVGVYDGRTFASKEQFFAFAPTSTAGVDVAVRQRSAGGPVLVAASGNGGLKTFVPPGYVALADNMDLGLLGAIDVG